MEIPAFAPNYASGAANSAGSALSKNYDTFLSLLTTQLQHQDPLEPMDSSEFTSQLVQFSSVEQSILTNSNLENLLNLVATDQATNVVNFIGKEVEALGDTATLSGGAAYWSYDLSAETASTEIRITDANGKLVYLGAGEQSKGQHGFTWNGLDNNGVAQPDGTYAITVIAKDSNGDTVSTTTGIRGLVTGVEGVDGVQHLIIGGARVPLSDITKVSMAPSQPGA